MMSYQNHSGAAEAAMVMWIVAAAVAAGAFVVTMSVVLFKEIGRVYQRAFEPSSSARVLWIALAALAAVLVTATLLAMSPATLPIAIYLGCWGFLAFIITIEGVDLYARRHEKPQVIEGLDDVLQPWPWQAESLPSHNGNGVHPEPIPTFAN